MEDKKHPLVSVPVITYNSAMTVVETLESIKSQTYQNLELIVSDDCSTDNTVAICQEWIEKNKNRFVRTAILTVEKNTGVSANLNRALRACQGKWVKNIAGDDILFCDCVGIYMEYVRKNPDAVCVFSKVEVFGSSRENREKVMQWFDYSFFAMSPKEQYEYLQCVRNCIPAATSFYNKNELEKLELNFDERIPLLEDYPMWLNLLSKGVRLDFVDKVTVKYRISETALSTTSTQSIAFRKSNAIFYKLYRFQYEYEHTAKKFAIENWLRAQNTIKQNMFWYIIFKMYKICVMCKLH